MAGKSMAFGGGGRFQAMLASGKSRALAAYIGRRAHGQEAMTRASVEGRKRAARKRHSHLSRAASARR